MRKMKLLLPVQSPFLELAWRSGDLDSGLQLPLVRPGYLFGDCEAEIVSDIAAHLSRGLND